MKKTIGYYRNLKNEILPFIPSESKTILDVGCGQSYFLMNVKNKKNNKIETWGIEPVEEISEEGGKNVDHFITGKVEDSLQFIPDNYFDVITFNDVLEHLLDPVEVLKKIKNKLSQNGVIVASIPNVRFFYNLKNLLIYKDWEYTESGILDSTHIRFFTKKSMIRLFESHGFEIVEQKGIHRINTFKFNLFNIITLGFFDDTKYLNFVIVVKPQV